MRPKIKVNFMYFWPGFSLATFEMMFPCVMQSYELQLSSEPDVMFYSVFGPKNPAQQTPDGRNIWSMPILPIENCLRVFMTGENAEPMMDHCDFAISFSALIDHPNHLRLPMWAYPGFVDPQSLIKSSAIDWERVARGKTKFCNFVYSHDVVFRNDVFRLLSRYRHVDAAGGCMNNMNGWRIPSGARAKLNFLKSYKFTLSVENTIWPGYQTEKLVQPMFVDSIPIYIGDPLARNDFDTAGYLDITSFHSLREMIDFVCTADCDRNLYLDILSAPHYRNNAIPLFAREETILAFFDRMFIAATERRQ